jgi:hypothetical protein
MPFGHRLALQRPPPLVTPRLVGLDIDQFERGAYGGREGVGSCAVQVLAACM